MHAVRARHAFDGTSFLRDGATVLVDGQRIVGVEPFRHEPPADCPVTSYDGTLLPGLVDAHVHLVANGDPGSLERAGTLDDEGLDREIERSLHAQAAAGVTTVRDLGDVGYRTLTHRDRAAAGLPRLLASGPPLTVPGGHCHFLGGAVAGVEAIGAAIEERRERGVDVVKVMASGGILTLGTDIMGAQFSAAELRAVVERAHEAGLQVLAHAHSLAGIEHALAADVDGIEHFTGMTEQGLDLPDDLLVRVASAGIPVDPTLGLDNSVWATMPAPPPEFVAVMQRLGLDPERFFSERIRQLARLRAHGIRVVAGVDAGAAPTKRHGNAWRMAPEFVLAGYPVAQALAMMTSGGADACGIGHETGRLGVGLAADLLVVDGDVATEPDSLSRPLAVLVRGTRVG